MPAACTYPLFIQAPHVEWQNVVTTANNTKDGSNTAWEQPLFTANSISGSFIDYIRIKPLGTCPSSAIRVFVNNGGATTQANNNALISEIPSPTTTWSETAALPDTTQYLKLALPAGYRLFATSSNTPNAGFYITAVGGDFGPGTPIYLKNPRLGMSNTLLTQNQTRIGSSGTLTQVFTANTANGSFLDHIRIKPLGTNTTSVARIWINDGGTLAQINNTVMFSEISLAATTLSEVASLVEYAVPLKLPLNPGYNVYVTLGTTVAAGWTFTAFGGDY